MMVSEGLFKNIYKIFLRKIFGPSLKRQLCELSAIKFELKAKNVVSLLRKTNILTAFEE